MFNSIPSPAISSCIPFSEGRYITANRVVVSFGFKQRERPISAMVRDWMDDGDEAGSEKYSLS